MVMKSAIAALAVLLSVQSMALSPDELRSRIKGDQQEKKDSASRLKMFQTNNTQIQALKNKDVLYTLPDGRKVQGVVLPNGKKSPAVAINGVLQPACLTVSGLLVAGVFEPQRQVIECSLESTELAFIDDAIYGQKIERAAGSDDPAQVQKKPASESPKIAKYGSKADTGGSSRSSSSGSKSAGTPPPKKADPNVYRFPAPSGQQAAVVSTAMAANTAFGVPRGSWAEVSLDRPISSADSGSVEFVLNEDVVGDFRTLPAGTTIFASKNINVTNKTLEAKAYLALLPGGEEVTVSGWIYSLNKTAGLSGKLIRDREGESEAAAGNAALAGLAAGAANITGGAGVPGAVVQSYTGDMVANEQRYSLTTPKAVVRVAPQRGLIQFVAAF